MADGPVADLYQRYKIGTNRITQWLADTASNIGKLETVVGRATRKAPKRDAQEDGSSNTVRITTSQLVRLASEISVNTLRDHVPPRDIKDIIIITEDVLAGRREYSVWNEQKTTTKDVEHLKQNESHQHFIHVLAEVLDHLKRAHKYSQPVVARPKAARGRKKAPAPSGPAKLSDSLILKNIYKGLAVEEPAIDSLEDSMEHISIVEPVVEPQPAASKPQTTVFELERPEGEDLFALWCLFKDFHKIREFLRASWQEYYDKKIGIHIAGELSDKALEIMQSLTEDFASEFPQLGTFEQVADRLDFQISMRCGAVESFSCAQLTPTTGDETSIPLTELLCIPAFACLSSLRKAWTSTDNPRSKTIYSFSDDCHDLNYRMRSLVVIIANLAEKSEVAIPDLDQFTTYLPYIFSTSGATEQLPLHVVMGYQTVMDTTDILGLAPTAYAGLYKTSVIAKAKWKQADRLRELVDATPSLFDEELSDADGLREEAAGYINDVVGETENEVLQMAAKERDVSYEAMPPLAEMFANFPTISGKYANTVLNQLYCKGVYSCDAGLLIMATTHLYYACRKTGALKSRWEDMEFFVNSVTVGPSSLGLQNSTEGPSNASACAKRFGMALGVSMTEYSREQKRKRGLVERVPLPSLATMLKKRPHTAPSTTWVLTVHNRWRIMTDRKLTGGRALKYAMTSVFNFLSSSSKSKDYEELSSQWKACGKLQPTELLSVLKTAMLADDEKLTFDYHAFLLQCASLMQWVLAMVREVDREVLTDRPLEQALAQLKREDDRSSRSVIVDTVDDILWLCASMEGSKNKDTPLVIISDYIESAIRQRGSSYHLDRGKNFLNTLYRTSADPTKEKMRRTIQHKDDLRGVRAIIRGSTVTMTGLETVGRGNRPGTMEAGEHENEQITAHQGETSSVDLTSTKLAKSAGEEVALDGTVVSFVPSGYRKAYVEDCLDEEDELDRNA